METHLLYNNRDYEGRYCKLHSEKGDKNTETE